MQKKILMTRAQYEKLAQLELPLARRGDLSSQAEVSHGWKKMIRSQDKGASKYEGTQEKNHSFRPTTD